MNKLIKHIKQYCNIDELVFDITLLIFFLINYYFFQEEKLISIVNPFVVVFIFLFAEFLVPFYLASIYSQFYIKAKNNSVYNIFSKIALVSSIATSVLVCYVVPFVFLDYNNNETAYSIYIFFNFMTGTFSIILGWTFGLRADKNISLQSIDLKSYFILIMSVIIFMGGLFLVGYSIYIQSGFPLLAFFLLFSYLLIIKDKIKKFLTYDKFMNYIFPFLLCFVLNFVFEILNDIIGFKKSFYAVVVSGVLPTRLIISFTPPFRLINFMIGIFLISLIIFKNIEYWIQKIFV
mgnify:CR=1 FL=1